MQLTKFMRILSSLKYIGRIIYWMIFITLILIAGLVAVSALDIPGNYKLFTVQSGSMEPEVLKGSIVVIKPQADYTKGDVITISEPENPKVSLTHRIVAIEKKEGKILYTTKGDANKTADTEKRPQENVIGKVLFSVPYAGYPVSYGKTRDGLIFLVVIPATIIIYSELMTIKNEAVRLVRERKKRKLTALEKAEVAVGQEVMEVEKEIGKVEQNIEKQVKKTVKKNK